MKITYLISILFLIISFLLYRKSNKSISIISSVIFSICLFICYQTFMVYGLSYFRLGGNLLSYSIFNLIVGIIIDFISFRRRKIQKYFFDKKEFLVFLGVLICIFLVVCYRFRGFNTISYASDDPAIHYRAALYFSDSLEKLTIINSKDVLFGGFDKMMPISYITGGMFIHLFSGVSSYRAFLIYDGMCLILYTLLFLATILHFFKNKDYLYLFVITMLYGLGFPLNNLVFGFCYLGLGVMVIHLIIYFFLDVFGDLEDDFIFKMIIMFILSFSIFFSYYLFMPYIYLAVGIYYIYLYKSKKIDLKLFISYVIFTLFIPCGIGYLTYFSDVGGIVKAASFDGDIYHNVTPILFFFLTSYCYFYYQTKKEKGNTFFKISFITLSFYILLFFVLHIFKIVSFYYFYKLFYVYWIYGIIFFSVKFKKYTKIFYGIIIVVMIGSFCTMFLSNQDISNFLGKLNVYYYNARNFRDDFIRFKKSDLELVDSALENKNICSYNDEFIVISYPFRNMWIYSILGKVPILNHVNGNHYQLYIPSIPFNKWEELNNYPCVLYFNDAVNLDYDKNKYEAILENDRGVLLKRKTVE